MQSPRPGPALLSEKPPGQAPWSRGRRAPCGTRQPEGQEGLSAAALPLGTRGCPLPAS